MTGGGWTFAQGCPTCGVTADRCRCGPAKPNVGSGGPIARMRMERRRGKPATVIDFANCNADGLKALIKELKRKLATGGSLDGVTIILMGDHRQRVRDELKRAGYRVKG